MSAVKSRLKKRLRYYLSPVLRVIIPWLGWLWLHYIRLFSSVQFRGLEHCQSFDQKGQPYILAFWHNRQIILPLLPNTVPINVLVSASRDGGYVAGMTELFGKKVVRGSSSKDGMLAMMQMMRLLRSGQVLAMSPDGPRGPAFQCKHGIIQLAQSLRVPILPVSFDNSRKRVLNSWDRFFLPRAFGKIAIVVDAPLWVGEGETLADACEQLNQALNQTGDIAADMVNDGR